MNRSTLVALGLGLVAILGAGGLVMLGASRPDPDAAQCAAAAPLTARLKPLATGEMAGFQVPATPRPLPPLVFKGPDGKDRRLTDAPGKITLLNLWATWCPPCRREMPSLDALQKALGSERFEVVAVNLDTRNLDKPKEWLKDNGIASLAYYSDNEAKLFQTLRGVGKATGLPVTLLVDGKGCELGVLSGAAEWASEDAKALIQTALAQ